MANHGANHRPKVRAERTAWQSSRKGSIVLLNVRFSLYHPSVRRLTIRYSHSLLLARLRSDDSFVAGKKTFSSIVSKVRAKMQDYDQGQGWSWSQNPPPGQTSQAASTSYHPPSAPSQQQVSQQAAYAPPYQSAQPTNPQRQTSQSLPARTSTYPSSPPRSGVLRPAAAEPAQSASPQRPSYYDPNTQGYDLYGDDEDIQLNDRTTPSATVAQSPATPPHADSPHTPPPPSDTNSPPSYTSPVSPPPKSVLSSTTPPVRSLSPAIAGARGTTAGTPGGVDFSTYSRFWPRFPGSYSSYTRPSSSQASLVCCRNGRYPSCGRSPHLPPVPALARVSVRRAWLSRIRRARPTARRTERSPSFSRIRSRTTTGPGRERKDPCVRFLIPSLDVFSSVFAFLVSFHSFSVSMSMTRG